MSLGDSWPEGAHCNGCRTFPQTHAEALEDRLGEEVTLIDLAGQAQPYFDTLGGGGSAGLLEALRTDEPFREEVAKGDIIVIATGPNDGGEIIGTIQDGTCGGKDDSACVVPLGRMWKRDFDAILDEIEALRGGRPTAIRLVNAANAFADPSFSPETLRGFEAYFEALTVALCDNAEAHEAICVDVRPVLNGTRFRAARERQLAGVDGRGGRAAPANGSTRARVTTHTGRPPGSNLQGSFADARPLGARRSAERLQRGTRPEVATVWPVD